MDTDELTMAVVSRSTLLVLVVNPVLTVRSTAVGDAATRKDELTMLSSGTSLTEGYEADAVNKAVGNSESRSVAVAPTLMPFGTDSI